MYSHYSRSQNADCLKSLVCKGFKYSVARSDKNLGIKFYDNESLFKLWI